MKHNPMKHPLKILTLLTLTAITLSQCTPYRSHVYKTKMKDLRTQVHIGDNIHAAKTKITDRYHYTSGPSDPTKLGKELWLHVNFGLQPTLLETLAYTADISLPFDNKPISAIIKATPDGTITTIE
ncbi:MAG: hypothetical protein ACSHX6_03745 [Akkermansiaceae bacterium]